jgi:histidinol-phosphate aminotransferase
VNEVQVRPFVSQNIETLKPYVPGKPIEETERELGIRDVVKLASNENALGPSPKAVEAMQQALAKAHLYPDGASFYLNRKLADFLKVLPEEVFVAHGSNEIIELLIRTFTLPDDEALLCKGSFLMYKVALQAHGRAFREVPMQSGFRYDLDAMAAALTPKTRLVFLANPDNPTGTAFGRKALERFLEKVPSTTFVALDEAYFEFVDWDEYPNGLDYFRQLPNLIVLRTFSKIYGLAGVRLGYAVMQSQLTAYLHRTRMPFNVSSIAQVGGVAALEDVEHVRKTCALTHPALRYFETELRQLGVEVPPSHANFVFADFGRPAQPIFEALLRKGLITRPVPAYGFPNALRISVGMPEQNERLIRALKEILSK